MKLKPRNIKRRVAHVVLSGRNLAHIRHYRGFGVHSPFVYGLIRNVFMPRSIVGDDTSLYETLRSCSISQRRARQLQNLYSVCAYSSFVMADASELPAGIAPQSLCIVTRLFPEERTDSLIDMASRSGATVCILEPTFSRSRYRLCKRLVREHCRTSVDNRGFLLLFYHDKLPKQHFKL